MQIAIKKLNENAVIPAYAKKGDAALDLTATSKEYNDFNNQLTFGTGLAIEIPDGYVGLIFPRSSICNTQLSLSNAVGVIDSGYRGEIKAVFRAGDRPSKNYEIGDRICQMIIMPFPKVELIEVQELSSTERGTEGFGSTGK